MITIELTLYNKKQTVNILPTYSFKNVLKNELVNDAQELFFHWFEKKDLEKSVFVCFENFRGLSDEYLRNEQRTFLVSHKWDDIADFCESHLDGNTDYDVNFAVFEFENYEDAFGYCKDLKEGF